MDPVTIGAIASVAVAALSSGSKGGGAAVTPQQANPITNSWMDSSGWTVATSGARATGGARSQSEMPNIGGISPLLIGAALIAFLVWTKAQKK
jgi:hypothetical protein